jgi:CHAT domain-containing protein
MQKEGTVGLTRAFLAAGAPSVISTHWAIEDSPLTTSMVNIFYSNLVHKSSESKKTGNSFDKAKALRQMMLSAIQDPTLRWDPRRWGAFFLSGLPS